MLDVGLSSSVIPAKAGMTKVGWRIEAVEVLLAGSGKVGDRRSIVSASVSGQGNDIDDRGLLVGLGNSARQL